MRKLFIGTVGILALSGSAFAGGATFSTGRTATATMGVSVMVLAPRPVDVPASNHKANAARAVERVRAGNAGAGSDQGDTSRD